jgi:aldose 1-epimerase
MRYHGAPNDPMMRYTTLLLPLLMLCHVRAARAEIAKTDWGAFEGAPVSLYMLRNANGASIRVSDYGATLVAIVVPDRAGRMNDVTLGFDDLAGYRQHRFIGSTVGRYGNRVAKGAFTLDDKSYKLATNNRPNHLHGGKRGFDTFVWKAETIDAKDGPAIRFTRTSPDGEEGYPGKLDVSVTYTLTRDNAVRIEYAATTDAPTVVNLTNHSHFNLAGTDGPAVHPVRDHLLQVHADRYTPFDSTRIPTGEIAPVEDTPLDFRQPTRIGEHIAQADGAKGGGYDHNFVVNDWTDADAAGGKLIPVATVIEPTSGRKMDVFSTEPGVQFYTDDGFNGTLKGKAGLAYPRDAGFCLETQHFPDSPNKPQFPSTVLKPGETYRSITEYRFSIAP